MIKRPWKTNELRLLRELYATNTASDIGARLNRSVSAILSRASEEGLRKPIEFFRAMNRKGRA